MLLRPGGVQGVGTSGSSLARSSALRSRPLCAPRRRQLAGARCTAAPDGSRPRVPSPNKEDIKKAILGYAGEEGGAAGALQQPGAAGAVPHGAVAAAPHGAADATAAAPGSWEDWKQYIEELDTTLAEIQALDAELADTVALEDYRRAAELKAKLAELEGMDTVGEVLKELDVALAEERYSDAAELRDVGGAGLTGWWAGRGEGDHMGHVVRITPEFGRYVAQAYTARELAEVTGWAREMSLRDLLMAGNAGAGGPQAGGGGDGEPGLPVFEVVVRRNPETGSLEQQPVALFSPMDLQPTDTMSEIATTPIDDVDGMAGEVTVEKDASTGDILSVTVELSGDVPPEEASIITDLLGGPEEVVSLDQLAGFFPSAQEPLEGLGSFGGQQSAGDEDDVQQQISDSLQQQEEASKQEQWREEQRRLEQWQAEQRRQQGLDGSASASGSGAEPTPLERLMARIEGRPAEGGAAPGSADGGGDSLSAELAAISGGAGPTTTWEEGGEQFASFTLQRAPAQIEWHSRDAFTIRARPPAAQQQQQQHPESAGSSRGGSAAETARRRVGDVLAADRAQDQQQQQPAPNPPEAPEGSGEERGERMQQLETEVQQWAQRRGAKKEQIEAIIKATMTAAIAQGIGAVPEQAAGSNVNLEGQCSYTRIPAERFCKTDPFSGTYLGAFGPHGPELLQLQRVMMDGEEWVHATKVTGDINVPAGEVSFRAKIGRAHRLSASESYPLELGVKGRYKGQGRVAQGGFQFPKWVEGELLLLTSGNPMTHGAELGFVYNMEGGVKRFLILFSRINLDELRL